MISILELFPFLFQIGWHGKIPLLLGYFLMLDRIFLSLQIMCYTSES